MCICGLKCWGTALDLIHQTRWKLCRARSLKRLFSSKHGAKKRKIRMDVNTETRPGEVVSATGHVWATIWVCLLLFCSVIMPSTSSHVALATLSVFWREDIHPSWWALKPLWRMTGELLIRPFSVQVRWLLESLGDLCLTGEPRSIGGMCCWKTVPT